jgi:hypothetical protein
MNTLSLQHGKGPPSKKRAAAGLSQGQLLDEGTRSTKIRSDPSLLFNHQRLNLTSSQNIFSNTFHRFFETENPPFNQKMELIFSHSPKLLRQPKMRLITLKQLVNEVKRIYPGLIMVEKKCVDIDQQQSSTTNKLFNEQ